MSQYLSGSLRAGPVQGQTFPCIKIRPNTINSFWVMEQILLKKIFFLNSGVSFGIWIISLRRTKAQADITLCQSITPQSNICNSIEATHTDKQTHLQHPCISHNDPSKVKLYYSNLLKQQKIRRTQENV